MEREWRKRLKAAFDGKKALGSLKGKVEDIGFSRLAILFLAGILLLLLALPSGTLSPKREDDEGGQETVRDLEKGAQDLALDAMREYARSQEEELEHVLSQVKGVGDVDVMITVASSEEKKTLQQENTSREQRKESDSAGGTRRQDSNSFQADPVLIDGEGGQEPYVVQIQSPQVEGVVVVAQGAGRGVVDAEIIAAVEALFPIGSHKIKVMKMED